MANDDNGHMISSSTYNVRYADEGEVVARIEFLDPGLEDKVNLFQGIIYAGSRNPDTNYMEYVKFAHARTMITKDAVREIIKSVMDDCGDSIPVRSFTMSSQAYDLACNKILEALDATD